MFKRYTYTCPDVIHLRKLQKRYIYTNLGVLAVFWGGLAVAAASASKKYDTPEIIDDTNE